MPAAPKIDAAKRAHDAGDSARALSLLSEALTEDPTNPHALNLKAVLLTAENDHDGALEAYAAAAARDTKNAVYRSDYAHALIGAGDFEAAEAELLDVLKIVPESSVALRTLAWLKRAQPGDALIDRLNALKSKAGVSDPDYVKVCYALGKCYDDIGEYDLAFENYAEANRRQNVRYEAGDNEKVFRDIKATLNAAFFEERKGCGHDSKKPVFVLGMPRSGSTLLEEKLSAFPGVKGLGECGDVIRIAAALTKGHPRRARYPHFLPDVPLRAFDGLGGLYVGKFERRHPAATHFVDKSLMNFAYVGFIKTILPHSLIIDSRRQAMDTCLSCYFHDLNIEHNYAFGLASLGHFYRGYIDLMAHWRNHADNLITVRYEEFIDTPDEHVQMLSRRLGLESGSGQVQPTARASHVKTWSAVQVRQPVYKSSVARWKNYEKHLGPLIDALGDLAE